MNVKRTVIGSAYRKPDDAGVPKKSDITVSTNDKNVLDVMRLFGLSVSY